MDVTWLKLKGFMHMCVIGCGDGPHNPKVVSSSLTPATIEKQTPIYGVCFLSL